MDPIYASILLVCAFIDRLKPLMLRDIHERCLLFPVIFAVVVVGGEKEKGRERVCLCDCKYLCKPVYTPACTQMSEEHIYSVYGKLGL